MTGPLLKVPVDLPRHLPQDLIKTSFKCTEVPPYFRAVPKSAERSKQDGNSIHPMLANLV